MALLKKSSDVPVPAGAGAARLTPIATNFDFLEGAFVRAERGRRTSLGAAVAALIVLSAFVLLGATATMNQRTDTVATATAQNSDAVAVAEIARLDQAGGISADQLRAHAVARQSSVKVALKDDTDVASLMAAVNNSTPAGVKLTSVEFTGVVPTAGPPAPAAPGGTAAPAPAPGAGVTSSRTLTVTGTASSFSKIGQWSSALANVPGLTMSADPTWTGGGDALTVTLSATVTEQSNSARAKAAAASDQYGFPKGAN